MFVFLKMAAWAQSPGANCASRNDENDVEIQLPSSVFWSTPSPKKRLVQMIWLNLVEMSQKNRRVKKMKTLRKKNSGHGGRRNKQKERC